VPYIHPPLYSTYMWAMERAYRQWGLWQGFGVYLQSALATVVSLAVLQWALPRDRRLGWALVLGALVVGSAGNLRPFEQYPVARLGVTAAGALLLRYAEVGGRGRLGAAWVLSIATVELHLNSWFVLGPLWLTLAILVPGRRRGLFWGLGALLVAFLASTWPGLYEVLREGPGHPAGWAPPLSVSAMTMEWTNPWTFLPLLFVATPIFADRPPVPLALGASLAAYTVITLGLQYRGLCMGGDFQSAHHYFELVDPLLAFLAVRWMQMAWDRADHWAVRALVVGAGMVIVLHQSELLLDGWAWLRELAARG
jgi:hypothetical protein